MAKLVAKDQQRMNHPRELIYAVLCDFASYKEWWPAPRSVRVLGPLPAQVGTALRLANGPLVRWTVTVVDLRHPAQIALQYSEGALRGDAAWTLGAEDGATRVIYEVNVETVPAWLGLTSKLLDLRRVHSRQVRRVFAALERRLGHLTASRL